jgi:hypothetical protein
MTPEHKKEVMDFISEVLDGREWRCHGHKWHRFPITPDAESLVNYFGQYQLKPNPRMLQLWCQYDQPGGALVVRETSDDALSSSKCWVRIGKPFPHPEDVEKAP